MNTLTVLAALPTAAAAISIAVAVIRKYRNSLTRETDDPANRIS